MLTVPGLKMSALRLKSKHAFIVGGLGATTLTLLSLLPTVGLTRRVQADGTKTWRRFKFQLYCTRFRILGKRVLCMELFVQT